MKFKNYLNESINYNNWVFPNNETIKSDWSEYKKKEEKKWKNRAKILNARWPLFKNISDFKNSLKKGKIVNGTDSFMNKVEHATSLTDMNDLKSMVHSYIRPRNIDRIINGFYNNDKIPYPIILKSNNRYFIMAGNTRQNSARILGIIPKILIVDVSKK